MNNIICPVCGGTMTFVHAIGVLDWMKFCLDCGYKEGWKPNNNILKDE
jgi:C4-type Zn-finger protein